jgi:hypothetical protein
MAKLNWDKRAAKDKACYLRQSEKIYTEHPVKLKRILVLKQIIQRIEKKGSFPFTINLQDITRFISLRMHLRKLLSLVKKSNIYLEE